MKKEFIGFYMPQEEDLKKAWSSDKTLFVFDTNVLLKLYSYQPNTVKDFFSIVENLGEKIWLPHQVGLEFQNRRLDIKMEEKKKFKELNENINDILKVESAIKQKFLQGRFPELDNATEKLFNDIKKLLEDYKEVVDKCDKTQPSIRTHDIIREKLDKYFEGKIGKAYTQAELNNIYTQGEERYKHKIPPGFKDNSKDKTEDYFYKGIQYKRKFGDLILWRQIIDKSKDDAIENVIFITDDEKEDWWFITRENGKKVIGPLANLTHEIIDESNISLFHMYSTTAFFEDAKKLISINVQESSIEEIKNIHTNMEAKEKSINDVVYWDLVNREYWNELMRNEKYWKKLMRNEKYWKELMNFNKNLNTKWIFNNINNLNFKVEFEQLVREIKQLNNDIETLQKEANYTKERISRLQDQDHEQEENLSYLNGQFGCLFELDEAIESKKNKKQILINQLKQKVVQLSEMEKKEILYQINFDDEILDILSSED